MNSDGKLGIAMLSFAHVHANGYADQVKSLSDCELVAIWDEDVDRGKTQADNRGVPFMILSLFDRHLQTTDLRATGRVSRLCHFSPIFLMIK